MSHKKRAKTATNGLVALSSAAIVAIYGTGYARTRGAVDRFTDHATERRPHVPIARGRTAVTADTRVSARPSDAPAATPRAPRTEAPPTKSKFAAPRRVDTPRVADIPRHESSSSRAPEATQPPLATVPSDATQPAQAVETTEPIVAPAPAQVPPAATAKYRDGTYLGWGTSRHGDIQATVTIEGGRITTAKVAQCLTRYSCAWVSPIPPVIIEQQGTTYDYVSGATESSDAFQNAVADALSHAL